MGIIRILLLKSKKSKHLGMWQILPTIVVTAILKFVKSFCANGDVLTSYKYL